MTDRQLLLRVEILERAIVNALRAALQNKTQETIQILRRVPVDESKYPEPIPVTGPSV